MTDLSIPVQTRGQMPGRALYIGRRGWLYISQLYDIFRSEDDGITWQLDCTIPRLGIKPILARFPLAARLLRYNVTVLRIMDDGARIAVARGGIYRAEPNQVQMTQTFQIHRGSRPMNVCIDGRRVIFGEYGDSYKNLEVHIYVSEDGGRTFEVGYTFPRGGIRHVHNVLFDPILDHYWVFVGDYGVQPGIGAMSKDLKTIEWVRRGDQKSRVMGAILLQDEIIYGTDSDIERNYIIRMEKRSGRIREVHEIQGSSLFATKFGPVFAISTCVEPNPSCPSNECSIYLSRDGDAWQKALSHRKDRHNPLYFQYGTLALPYSYQQKPLGMFSGQAVVGAHDRVSLVTFDDREAF
jgi:hypothetical protein